MITVMHRETGESLLDWPGETLAGAALLDDLDEPAAERLMRQIVLGQRLGRVAALEEQLIQRKMQKVQMTRMAERILVKGV